MCPISKCSWTLLMSTQTQYHEPSWKEIWVAGTAGPYCCHRLLVKEKRLSFPYPSCPVQSLHPPKFTQNDEPYLAVSFSTFTPSYSYLECWVTEEKVVRQPQLF